MTTSVSDETRAGQLLGRVYLFHCCEGLPLTGPDPEFLVHQATRGGARLLVLDTLYAAYVDSDGLRWLLYLRDSADAEGLELRIAARQGGKIWRNLVLLKAGLNLYASVHAAFCAPMAERGSKGGEARAPALAA